MYNQGLDQQKIDTSSTTPHYPQPDNQVAQMIPQPSGGAYPPPQPSGGAYPPPGAYPSFPVQQKPTNTVHNTNTTVVMQQQQQPAAVVIRGSRGWSTGMCSCFDQCGVCLIGLCSCLCCLPFIECQVSGSAGECCCVGFCCPTALRTKIRARHNIQAVLTAKNTRLCTQSSREWQVYKSASTAVTSYNSSTTMNNNPTTHPTYKNNNHASITIPRYINPVFEKSHPNPGMEMTSSSRDTNQDVNCSTTPKVSGMVKPPYMPVTQEPQSTMHHVQGVNNYNGGRAVIEGFSGTDEIRNWSSGLFSCCDDWSSCLLGLLCPCCLAMTISCSLNECCCTANCYPVATRTKIRTKYNIVVSILNYIANFLQRKLQK
ncbi:Hypothetical predicted protein [Paramuricea clavata]|uniref:Uncharacterized protein n=1 Tax=Paramuricea clavata TaxID=317549 RepID=A0A7D9DL16_PARCT|nr:Hypothetical predicted protein [Paramuricea clavata]